MDDADLLQLVREGKKPGAYLDWMAWPYAGNLPGLDGIPIYWDKGDKWPNGVAVARAGCLVREVITPDDIAFFKEYEYQGMLRGLYGQYRDAAAAPVLAELCGRIRTMQAPGMDRSDMMDDIMLGLLLGYPRCCVEDFAAIVHRGRPDHFYSEVSWLRGSLYHLCLECAREGRIKYQSNRQASDKKDYICEECQKCWDHPGRQCIYD